MLEKPKCEKCKECRWDFADYPHCAMQDKRSKCLDNGAPDFEPLKAVTDAMLARLAYLEDNLCQRVTMVRIESKWISCKDELPAHEQSPIAFWQPSQPTDVVILYWYDKNDKDTVDGWHTQDGIWYDMKECDMWQEIRLPEVNKSVRLAP